MYSHKRDGAPLTEQERRYDSLRSLLGPRWKAIAGLASTSFASGLLEAAFLLVATKAAFVVSEGDTRVELAFGRSIPLGATISIGVILVVLRMAAAVGSTWQSARLTSSVNASIRSDLATAFLRATWSSQHGGRVGHLQELLTTFAGQSSGLIGSMGKAITAAFSLIALLATAMIVDPMSSLVVIGAVIVLASMLQPVRAAIRRQAGSMSMKGMQFATSLGEISQLGLELHVFGVQRQTEERVSALIAGHEAGQRRLRFLQGLVPALYSGVAYLAVLGGLAAVAALGTIDLTAVGAVMLIMLRSLSYGQAMQTSSAAISGSRPFLGALDQQLEEYRAAGLVDGTKDIDAVGSIEVSGVSFEYTPGTAILKDIDLRIEPCEVIGIVGPSGGGKSTLVQLLLGLRPPKAGRILADGTDLADIRRARWNRMATFVPQDAHFIAGTVADNIRFLREDVSQADIEQAARLAHLHEDIVGWDNGYARVVGEQGSKLSGGQQQRLIIARALVERPGLLILDEPTSALDVRSETLIRETLDKLREDMIIIIIAHRLSTLAICSRIMVIQEGQLKAFDTPSRLEETSEFYQQALVLSGMR